MPNHTLHVVKAVIADLPAVVKLFMAVEAQHEAYWKLRWQRRPGLDQMYQNWMSKRLEEPRMLIGVARVDDAPAVAGAILATIEDEIPIYVYREYGLVQDVAVEPSHQRLGIAQALLRFAADWSRSHGLNQLRLHVANQNPHARAAFEKAGFIPTFQEMVLPL